MRIHRQAFLGGSWYFNPTQARVACRHWNTPDRRYYNLGLRLARSPVQRMAP